VPQLCHRDRANFELIVRLGSQPSPEIENALLAADNDVRID
jgi:hypothetical protein